MPGPATELTVSGIVVVCTAFGSVFSVAVGVYNFFNQRGKKQGVDEATVLAHGSKIEEHGLAIKSLQAGHNDLNTAVAVLKDLHARGEEDGRIQNSKLDALLQGQSTMRGELNARYHLGKGSD